MVRHFPQKGDFMLKIDLKEAYSVVPICKKHRTCLRLTWAERLYEYTALPFSLAEGPRLFTKIIKPVVMEFTLKKCNVWPNSTTWKYN